MSPNPFRKSSDKEGDNIEPVIVRLDPEFENSHIVKVAEASSEASEGWKHNQYLASLAGKIL